MANSKGQRSPLFRLSIEKLFDSWTSLQISVENGQGNGFGKQIDLWMRNVVEDFFYENPDLEAEEVGEYIETIVDNELDTRMNDGSLELISSALCSHFRLAMDGNAAELNKLHSELDITAAASKTKIASDKEWFKNKDNSDDDDDDNQQEEQMDTDQQTPENSISKSKYTEPDEDGWCTVVKHNKKH